MLPHGIEVLFPYPSIHFKFIRSAPMIFTAFFNSSFDMRDLARVLMID